MRQSDTHDITAFSGPSFFGLDYPAVLAEIETLPDAAQCGLLGPPDERYVFRYHLPSKEQIDEVKKRSESVVQTTCTRLDSTWIPQARASSAVFVRTTKSSAVDDTEAAARPEGDPGALTRSNDSIPLSMRYRQMKQEESRQRVEVRRSMIHGWGVFAQRDIAAHEIICEYVGEIVRQSVADYRERFYEMMHECGGLLGGCYMFRLDSDAIVDATSVGSHARFINHCCDANAYARIGILPDQSKHIFIFALRPIHKDEEITYDYQFPLEEGQALQCNCGAYNCIGRMN